MALFTIILEYRGGTYIAQVAARGPRQALARWARDVSPKTVAVLGARAKAALVSALVEHGGRGNPPTPIEGLPNVWCAGFPIPGGLVNIIKTERPAGGVEQ
jgi:hypothetical protein